MRFGICCDLNLVDAAAKAGFDYFEAGTLVATVALEGEEAFNGVLERVRSAALPCEAINGFIPAQVPVTGPQADLGKVEAYVTTVFARASRLGVQRVVFGSAGARNVPEGFDRAKAMDQLTAACAMMAPLAAAHGIVVVLEPLRYGKSNIINTVSEGADLVRRVAHTNFRLLADGFHWARNGESVSDIVAAGELLMHTHVATMANRQAPGSEPCDKVPEFFGALRQAGYDQRVSIEGKVPDAADLPRALKLMRDLAHA